MKNQLGGFGDISDISDIGDVDLFGLDAFGNPTGMGAGWGALIGAGVATTASIAIRAFAKKPWWYKYSEALGGAVGLLTGGVMMFFKGTRHAGLVAAGTALAVNGARQLEYLFAPGPAELVSNAIEAAKAGVPQLTPEQAAAMQPSAPAAGVEFERTPVVPFGIATMEPTGAMMAGAGEGMPQLLGADPSAHRVATATLLGVPGLQGALSGMASSFGATLFGN